MTDLELHSSDSKAAALRLWICSGVLAVLGALALTIDPAVAGWAAQGICPSTLWKICTLSEAFGHGVGVALILVTIAVLDPEHRRALPRMLSAALGSGMAANVVKLMLGRTRPAHFDWHAGSLESFGPAFPLLSNPAWQQSFPSSHSATAAGLAIALAWAYPRGKALFAAFAVFACCQRILEESHFTSDVLWGAAIGCAFAPFCTYASGLARVFDRLEAGPDVERVAPSAGHTVSSPNCVSSQAPAAQQQRPAA